MFGRPIIVTNHQYRFLVAEQLAEIGVDADILLEPHRRDSAPAIVAGAVHALRRGEAAVVLALAADHVVTDVAGFVAACRTARAAAESGHIVTFGVTPDRPATEYGYIRRGKCSAARASSPPRNSSRSRTRRRRALTSSKAICGTRATCCSARASSSTNIAASMPRAPRRSRQRSRAPARISASSRSRPMISRAQPQNRSTMR